MNRQKTSAFLADCLSHMPDQTEQFQSVVNTVIAGLTRITDGQEWPEDEVLAAMRQADAAWSAGKVSWASARAAIYAADWADLEAADWSEWATKASVATADWAARAHPDPDAERARQELVREELGI